jgi:hypothetical protein
MGGVRCVWGGERCVGWLEARGWREVWGGERGVWGGKRGVCETAYMGSL